MLSLRGAIHPEAEPQHTGQGGERGPASHLSVGAGIKEEYCHTGGCWGLWPPPPDLPQRSGNTTISHLLFKTAGFSLLLQREISSYFPLWHATFHPLILPLSPPHPSFLLTPLASHPFMSLISITRLYSISFCSFSSSLPLLIFNSSAQEQFLVLVCLECSQKLRKILSQAGWQPLVTTAGLAKSVCSTKSPWQSLQR